MRCPLDPLHLRGPMGPMGPMLLRGLKSQLYQTGLKDLRHQTDQLDPLLVVCPLGLKHL